MKNIINWFSAFYLTTFFKPTDFETDWAGNVIIPTSVRREIGFYIFHGNWLLLDKSYSDHGFNDSDEDDKLFLDKFGKKV